MNNQDISQVVIDEVCNYYRTTFDAINVKSRQWKLVEPRQFIYYFLRDMTDMTFSEIGMLFRQSHSNVICSIRTLDNLITVNGYYRRYASRRFMIQQKIGVDDLDKWINSIAQL